MWQISWGYLEGPELASPTALRDFTLGLRSFPIISLQKSHQNPCVYLTEVFLTVSNVLTPKFRHINCFGFFFFSNNIQTYSCCRFFFHGRESKDHFLESIYCHTFINIFITLPWEKDLFNFMHI